MPERNDPEFHTKHLNIEESTPAIPHRGTGPLDYFMPWVIELRIIGTPSVLQIKLSEKMLVGRSDRNDGPPPDIDFTDYEGYDKGVSRQHAVMSAMNSRVTIRDLNSSNGTYLNGGRLEPGREYRISHGDRLTFGRMDLQVHFVVTPSSFEKEDRPYSDIDIPVIGNGQRVLILDEDREVAQTIAGIMQIAGFKVQTVYGINEALTVLDQDVPDAVILEIVLKDRSGIELIKHIRSKPQCKNTQLIVVSSAGTFQFGQAISTGANACLGKPIGADELIGEFSRVLHLMDRS